MSLNESTNAKGPLWRFLKELPRLGSAVLPFVGALLPFSLSFSIIHTSPNAASYEEIVACSYLQAMQYDAVFFIPLLAFVLMVLLAVTVVLTYFVRARALKTAAVVLSAASLVSVLALILWQGLERFTPTSLTVAFLLLCSLVISLQQLTGLRFIDPTTIDDD